MVKTLSGVTNFTVSDTFKVKKVSANNSLGSNGQVLTSNGTATYWSTPVAEAVVNTDAQFTWSNTQLFNANVTVNAALIANGSSGSAGQVLHTNGSGIYWAADDVNVNTTYDLLAIANTEANKGIIRLKDVNNANDDVYLTGAGGVVVSSNASHILITGAPGDITGVNAGDGLTGNTASGEATIAVLPNTGIIANATGTYVNAAYIATLAANTSNYANASYTNTFTVGTSTYFISNGQVLIGSSTPEPGIGGAASGGKLQVHGAGFDTISVFANSDTLAPSLRQHRKRVTGGTVQAGDITGIQQFGGWSGTNYRLTGRIVAAVDDGTISDTSMPGYLAFETTANGSVTTTERIRISSNGNVGVGTNAPNSKMHIQGSTLGDGGTYNGTGSVLYVKQDTNWTANQQWALYVSGYSYLSGFRINADDGIRALYKVNAGGQLGFATAYDDPITFTQSISSERMRIAAGGNVGIGTSSPDSKLHVRVGYSNTVAQAFTIQNPYDGADVGGSSILFKNFYNNALISAYSAPGSGQGGTLQLQSYNSDTVLNTGIVLVANGNMGVSNTTPAHRLSVNGTSYFQANVTLNAALVANGGVGSAGQVLHSNGTATYWAADDNTNTTYDLLTVANTEANKAIIRLQDSGNANDDVFIIGANGITTSSNSSGAYAYVVGGNTVTVNATGIHVNTNLSITSLNLSGNLTVSGGVTVIGANTLSIVDNFIYLNANNTTQNVDLGFAGNYNDGTYRHAGFFRDATDGYWKVFDGYAPEPDANVNIDTSNTTFNIAGFWSGNLRVGNTSVYATINSTSFSGTSNVATYVTTATTTNTFSVGTGTYFVNSGSVGIGLSTPLELLHVHKNSANVNQRLEISPGNLYSAEYQFGIVGYGTVAGLQYSDITKELRLWGNNPSNYQTFYVANAERMRITNTGNIGIGTSAPKAKLHINANVAGTIESLRLQGRYSTIGDGTFIRFTNYHASGLVPNALEYNLAGIRGYDYDNNWGGGLDFQTATGGTTGGTALTTKMTIAANGNVGIGITSPAAKLNIAQPAGTFGASNSFLISTYSSVQHFRMYMDGNWTTHIQSIQAGANVSALAFGTNSTEYMRISNTGNVGIGTTSPAVKLQIDGESNLSSGTGTTVALRIRDNSQDGGAGTWNTSQQFTAIEFYSVDGSTPAGASVRASVGTTMETSTGTVSSLTFFTNDGTLAERMRVTNVGHLAVGVTSAIVNQGRSITVGSSTGSTIALTTAIAAGTDASPIFTDITFRGYANYEKARIRSGDNSQNSAKGFLSFWTSAAANNTVVERMRIDDAGNVGIGETNPQRKLTVRADSTGTITAAAFYNADTTNNNGTVFSFRSDTTGTGAATFQEFAAVSSIYEEHNHATRSGSLDFFTVENGTGASRLRVAANGNIGIGTTSPSHKLHVNSSAGTIARFTGNTDTGVIFGSGGLVGFSDLSGNNGFIFNSTSSYAYVQTNGAERIRVNSAGNIAIGISDADARLHVDAQGFSNPAAFIARSPSGQFIVRDYGLTTSNSLEASIRAFSAKSGYLTFIQNTDYLWSIGHAAANTDLTIFSGSVGGGTERLRLTSGGLLGVGNSAPSHRLSVNGTSYFQANVTLNAALLANSSAGTAGQVLKTSGTGVYWAADIDTNTTYDLLAVANTTTNQGIVRLKDSANANDDVQFTGANGVVVSSNATHVLITGQVNVDTNTTYDLLTVANASANEARIRLKDINNSNDDILVVGANGITTFSNATAAYAYAVGSSTVTVNTSGIHVNPLLTITDLTVSGNLSVLGDTVTLNVASIAIEDSLIEYARNQNDTATFTDALDIGFYGSYGNTANSWSSGLFRDQSDNGIWKLFQSNGAVTNTNIDTANSSLFRLAPLEASSFGTTEAGYGSATGGAIANATTIAVGNSTVNTAVSFNRVEINQGSVNNNSSTYGFRVLGNANDAVGYSGYEFGLLNSTANATGFLRLARTASTAYLGMELQSQSRDGFRILTGASSPVEALRVDASGNVGVGSSSPVAKLEVKAATDNQDPIFQITEYRVGGAPLAKIYESGDAGVMTIGYYGLTASRAIINGGASAGASSLQLYSGANSNVLVTSSGSSYFNGGSVGIGTSNPERTLDVNGTVLIRSENSNALSTRFIAGKQSPGTGAGSLYLQYGIADFVQIGNGTTQSNFYVANGNVGIGTTNPQAALDLGAATRGRAITWGSDGAGRYASIFAPYSASGIVLAGGFHGNTTSDSYVSSHTGSYYANAIRINSFGSQGIQFFTDAIAAKTAGAAFVPTERMRITSAGDVGIGTITPTVGDVTGTPALSVRGTNARINIGTNATDMANGVIGTISFVAEDPRAASAVHRNLALIRGIYTGGNSTLDTDIAFYTATAGSAENERLRILGNGNVGIGTTTPATLLNLVTASTAADVLRIGNGTQSLNLGVNNAAGGSFLFEATAAALRFGTNNTERMRITSTGNVVIGSTTATQKFVVAPDDGGDTRDISTFFNTAAAYNAAASNTPEKVVSGLRLGWYTNYWQIGATRSGGTGIDGMVISVTNNSVNTNVMVLGANGNIGVGLAPRAKLDVLGDIWTDWNDRFIGTVYLTGDQYRLGMKTVVNTRDTQIWSQSADGGGVSGITFYTGTTPSERMRITAAGNVGINTTSPMSKLQVGAHTFSGLNGMYSNNRVGISNHGNLTGLMLASTYNDATYPEYGLVFVQGPNTTNYNVWSVSPDGPAKGNSLNFIYQGNSTNIHVVTPKVVFSGDGNIIVGGSSAGTRNGIRIDKLYSGISLDGGGGTYAQWGGTYGIYPRGGVGLGIGSAVGISFEVNGTTGGAATEAMRIASTGQVIIGTTSSFATSTVPLYVRGGLSGWSVFERNSKRIYINPNYSDAGTAAQVTAEASSNVALSLSARETLPDLYLTTTGNVGIGTTTPEYKLHVSEADNTTTQVGIGTSAAWGEASWRFVAAGTNYMSLGFTGGTSTGATNVLEALNIQRTGNVGIGTTNPGYKLQVVGSFAATTKSFVIDHPTKPNHKLRYGSLESPYHGVRLTGEAEVVAGVCTVKLPDYIHALCHQEGAQVQLTNIKHGKVLWVDEIDIDNNEFTVAAETNGNYKFYWSFTAIRKDIEDMVVEFENNEKE